jgi:hypothetical protein
MHERIGAGAILHAYLFAGLRKKRARTLERPEDVRTRPPRGGVPFVGVPAGRKRERCPSGPEDVGVCSRALRPDSLQRAKRRPAVRSRAAGVDRTAAPILGRRSTGPTEHNQLGGPNQELFVLREPADSAPIPGPGRRCSSADLGPRCRRPEHCIENPNGEPEQPRGRRSGKLECEMGRLDPVPEQQRDRHHETAEEPAPTLAATHSTVVRRAEDGLVVCGARR